MHPTKKATFEPRVSPTRFFLMTDSQGGSSHKLLGYNGRTFPHVRSPLLESLKEMP